GPPPRRAGAPRRRTSTVPALRPTARIFSRKVPGRPPRSMSTERAGFPASPGRGSALAARHGDLVPFAPVGPDVVALGLARARVRGRGVQRVPVVGGLKRPAGPHDRA